ncbi:hypothetical protein IRJ41_000823, partial [Triplophysa rosa]
ERSLEEMSFGRLLRRASSKASDLLTFNVGSGGSRTVLDGEIIFSKNNVCVHPSETLPGLPEHHPGYLCVHLEKDETLGSTLILTWVPNSRIQRQDEEALRYITPESSPVRRNPRRRAHRGHSRPPPAPEEDEDEDGAEPPLPNQQLSEEGDEGSCELSADEIPKWSEYFLDFSGTVVQQNFVFHLGTEEEINVPLSKENIFSDILIKYNT